MSLLEKIKRALSDGPHLNTDLRKTEAYLHACFKASMTLETVVLLPLFTGFLIFLLFCFRVMQVQVGMEQALAYTARVTAASIRESEKTVSPAKIRILLTQRIRKEKIPYEYIDRGLRGIGLQYSEFDQEEILLHASYQMTVPTAFFGKLTYPVEQEVSARKWTGWSARKENDGKNAYVYVTRTGRVYHKSRECGYLDLSIHLVPVKSVGNLRNKNGEKYKQCRLCVKQCGSKSGYYYITDYGDCCHCDITCSGLKRVIYVIPLKQAGKRRGCSKCTGG